MTQKQILLEVLKYLNHRLNTCNDGNESRELCGLVCAIEDGFGIKREEHNIGWAIDSQTDPTIEEWKEH